MNDFGEALGRGLAYIIELPQATWSPWSPDGEDLLISEPFDEAGTLQLVPIDGSDPRVIATGSFFTPTWSPDGTAIAFGTRRQGEGFGPTELWTMSPDGSNRRCLVTSFAPAWFTPVWSPDGRWIAYCTDTIEVTRTDGSERRSLGHGYMPVWSPDSIQVAHLLHPGLPESGRNAIHLTRIDGSGTRPLTSGSAPSWSPDGDRLVFQDVEESDALLPLAVFVIDADGSNRRRLCAGLYPRWSPSGARILVQRVDDSLVTIRPDGSDERVLSTDARFGRWSPDGEWIAFQWQWDVHVMRADGSDRRALGLVALGQEPEP